MIDVIVLENENLSKYTTLGIGGIAKKMYLPEDKYEMQELIKQLQDYNIIGAGSNLLINDKKIFENVICTKKMKREIIDLTDGKFEISSSVMLPYLVKEVNKKGYGGIEFLASVPGTFGGGVVMNAGRGRNSGEFISNYVENITVIKDGRIVTYSKEECEFAYRESYFYNHPDEVIISGIIQLPRQEYFISESRQKKRLDYCRNTQDHSGRNVGSVFNLYNKYIMCIMQKMHVGWKHGIHFSNKTSNWIINEGEGTYKQVIFLIKLVICMHKVTFLKYHLEVIVWR